MGALVLAIFHKMEVKDKLKKLRECGSCCSLLSREKKLVSLQSRREKIRSLLA